MRPGWGKLCDSISHNFPHPGCIACCSAPNSRPPATKALHTICGNNTSTVSNFWWWAYKCPKYVEQIISSIKQSVASSWFSSLRLQLTTLDHLPMINRTQINTSSEPSASPQTCTSIASFSHKKRSISFRPTLLSCYHFSSNSFGRVSCIVYRPNLICGTAIPASVTFIFFIFQYHCNLSQDIQQSCLKVTSNGM